MDRQQLGGSASSAPSGLGWVAPALGSAIGDVRMNDDSPAELVRHLRVAVTEGTTRDTFEVLRSSHHVFGVGARVVKLFRPHDRHEPEREWEGLAIAFGLGIGPRPILFDPVGELPAVVMTRVAGLPRAAALLSPDDIAAIGRAHVAIHAAPRSPSTPLAINHPARIRARTRAALQSHLIPQAAPEIVQLAWARGGAWLASPDATSLDEPPRLAFCRGDPNLANYLFDGDDLRLVDFEDCGVNDPAFELADMAEHLNSRAVPETAWELLQDVFELAPPDRTRFRLGRRLAALFWLTILVLREASARARGPETAEEQAGRVVELLEC